MIAFGGTRGVKYFDADLDAGVNTTETVDVILEKVGRGSDLGLSRRAAFLLAQGERRFQLAGAFERQIRMFGNAIAQEFLRMDGIDKMEAKWVETKLRVQEIAEILAPFGNYWNGFIDALTGALSANSSFVERIVEQISSESDLSWMDHVELLADILPVSVVKRVIDNHCDVSTQISGLEKLWNVLPECGKEIIVQVLNENLNLSDRDFVLANFPHLKFFYDIGKSIDGDLLDTVISEIVENAYKASNPFVFLIEYRALELPEVVKLRLDRVVRKRVETNSRENGVYLAHCIHILFRSLQFYIDHRKLESIQTWFDMLSDRGPFLSYHKNNLIKRLISDNSYAVTSDLELQKLLRLPILDSLIVDYMETKSLTKEISVSSPVVSFHVFNSCYVPWSCEFEPVLPSEICSALQTFETEFKGRRKSTKLRWDYELTRCVLSVRNCTLKRIKCNALTVVVLMALPSAKNKQEIAKRTGLDASKVDEVITVLEKMRVIEKHGKRWVFSVASQSKLKIPFSITFRQEPSIANAYSVDARLIQIIKMRQHISEAGLIREYQSVDDQIDDNFLQTRIRRLIEKQLIYADNSGVLSFQL